MIGYESEEKTSLKVRARKTLKNHLIQSVCFINGAALVGEGKRFALGRRARYGRCGMRNRGVSAPRHKSLVDIV